MVKVMPVSEGTGIEHVLQLISRDGGVTQEAVLETGEFEIGRLGAGFSFPEDEGMAARAAHLNVMKGRVFVHDSNEGSGVWLRIQGNDGRLLKPQDQVWLGDQILIIRREKSGWEIRHHGPDGLFVRLHRIPSGGLFIGRGSDLVLDADDSRLSRRHAQLVLEADGLRLYDRGARNGTYLKLTEGEELAHCGEFRVSTNLFRYLERGRVQQEWRNTDSGISISPVLIDAESAARDSPAAVISEPTSPAKALLTKPKRSLGLGARLRRLGRSRGNEPDGVESKVLSGTLEESDGREHVERTRNSLPRDSNADDALPEDGSALEPGKCLLVLDFDGDSISLEVTEGQTILEAVQEAGLARGEPVDWECGDGGCGVCVMGVVRGANQLDPPEPETGEMRTIQITEQVVPDPLKYRLACLARVRGTVRLRKLT